MASYHFASTWRLQAPIEKVWDELEHPERWPGWWREFRDVEELEPGDEEGRGALKRFSVRSTLPYTLVFDGRVTRVEPPHVIEMSATGELEGKGVWTLMFQAGVTEAHYTWDVVTTKRWMNVLSPLARPFFAWNHDVVMRHGGESLALVLGAPLVGMELSAPSAARLGASAVALGAATLWFVQRSLKRSG